MNINFKLIRCSVSIKPLIWFLILFLYRTQCSTVGQTSYAAASSGRSCIASEMKLGMVYEVIVTNIEGGVRKFWVQLKESKVELQELQRKLDSVQLRSMRKPIRGALLGSFQSRSTTASWLGYQLLRRQMQYSLYWLWKCRIAGLTLQLRNTRRIDWHQATCVSS